MTVQPTTRQRHTIDDLLAMPDDGKRYELIDGEIVEKEMASLKHSRLGAWLIAELEIHRRANSLGGYVTSSDGTYQLDQDNARIPDVAYLSPASAEKTPKGAMYGPFAPDLSVEIKSPSNTHRELRVKALRYLVAGSRLVWIIDPENELVHVYRPGLDAIELDESSTLDGYDVLPGLLISIAAMFKQIEGM